MLFWIKTKHKMKAEKEREQNCTFNGDLPQSATSPFSIRVSGSWLLIKIHRNSSMIWLDLFQAMNKCFLRKKIPRISFVWLSIFSGMERVFAFTKYMPKGIDKCENGFCLRVDLKIYHEFSIFSNGFFFWFG